MLAGPPLRTEPSPPASGLGEQLTQLIEEANTRPVSHISLSMPGVKLDLRRNGAGDPQQTLDHGGAAEGT